ncbi:hypothetical protein CPS_3392 [Colwellia psychrerythraea 34H]|uniref:Uncharacterized protein n=1 Tax=Colwellia psychrerythraea (strain 34H / ATCC BAA-681) TaxID=167879 RepID=Q47YQ3_COLP3|nr:hypothetical protein CPS_3392 [Colwellia psychrerythraea 34H]
MVKFVFLQVQLLLTKAKKRTDTIYKIKKGTVNSDFVIW